MNIGLAIWIAMIASLILSVGALVLGIALLALFIAGIIDLWLGVIGLGLVVKAMISGFLTVMWFIEPVR